MQKRCSGIRGKLKEDSRFVCKIYANQQTEIVEDFPGTELNDQSLEIVEKFCYLGTTIRASGFVVDSVITRIESRWS